MTAKERRRRGVVLVALALACGGLAASQVQGRVRAVEQRVGPLVPVVVARGALAPGTRLESRVLERRLGVRQVPARFAPPDSFASPRDLAGLSTATAVPAGGYVTAAQLERGGRAEGQPGALGRGERAVEVAVAGGPDLAGTTRPGARVDVLVTSAAREGAGRTFVALESVEVLGLRAAGTSPGAEAAPDGAAARAEAIATLRVSVRQAVFLTAAQNFAREVRLLARAPSDRERVGPQSVDAAGL